MFDPAPFRLRYKVTRTRPAAGDQPEARVLVNAEDVEDIGFPSTLEDMIDNVCVYANGSLLFSSREPALAANINRHLCKASLRDWGDDYGRTLRPTRKKWQNAGFGVENGLLDSVGAGGNGSREIFCALNMLPFTKTGSNVASIVDESLKGSLLIPPRSTFIIRIDFVPPSETTCMLTRRGLGSTNLFNVDEQAAQYEDDIQINIVDLTLFARHRLVSHWSRPSKPLKIKYQGLTFNYLSVPDNVARVSHYAVIPSKAQRFFLFFLRASQITPRPGHSAEKKFLRPSRLKAVTVTDASALESPLLSLKKLETPAFPDSSVMSYLTGIREVLQDPSYKLADFAPLQPTDESYGFILLSELTLCQKKPEMVHVELEFMTSSNVSNLYLCLAIEEEKRLKYMPSDNAYLM